MAPEKLNQSLQETERFFDEKIVKTFENDNQVVLGDQGELCFLKQERNFQAPEESTSQDQEDKPVVASETVAQV